VALGDNGRAAGIKSPFLVFGRLRGVTWRGGKAARGRSFARRGLGVGVVGGRADGAGGRNGAGRGEGGAEAGGWGGALSRGGEGRWGGAGGGGVSVAMGRGGWKTACAKWCGGWCRRGGAAESWLGVERGGDRAACGGGVMERFDAPLWCGARTGWVGLTVRTGGPRFYDRVCDTAETYGNRAHMSKYGLSVYSH